MPLTPSFSVAPTSNPAAVLVTDASTGSDVAIVDRVITIYKSDNSILGTFDFPLSAGASITISPFVQDTAVQFQINWNNSGGASLYVFNVLFAAVQFAEAFYYSLTQSQTAQPNIINDQQYFQNKGKLRTLIDSALQAISVGNDIFSALGCIAQYQIMIQNPTIYF